MSDIQRDPSDVAMEQFLEQKMTRRAALRKLGITSGTAMLMFLGVDNLARIVAEKMQQNEATREIGETVAHEFRNAGAAWAETPYYDESLPGGYSGPSNPSWMASGGPDDPCTKDMPLGMRRCKCTQTQGQFYQWREDCNTCCDGRYGPTGTMPNPSQLTKCKNECNAKAPKPTLPPECSNNNCENCNDYWYNKCLAKATNGLQVEACRQTLQACQITCINPPFNGYVTSACWKAAKLLFP